MLSILEQLGMQTIVKKETPVINTDIPFNAHSLFQTKNVEKDVVKVKSEAKVEAIPHNLVSRPPFATPSAVVEAKPIEDIFTQIANQNALKEKGSKVSPILEDTQKETTPVSIADLFGGRVILAN